MKISFKLSAVLLLMGFTGCMQTTVKDLREEAMNRYIDELMVQMSVEEKLGQLNLPAANDITTGRARSSNTAEKIRQGLVLRCIWHSYPMCMTWQAVWERWFHSHV